MESFGEKLRTTRESLGYSIEQIARDTHISKKYLMALENEDFSIFPGETYLKGFLQNYSEYLGLNHEEMLTNYKNIKIQEQPIPIDQLLDQKTSAKKMPLLAGVIGGGIVIILIIIIIALVNPFKTGGGSDDKANEKTKEYAFEGQKASVDVMKGFVIKVLLKDSTTAPITTQKIDKGVSLSFKDGSVDLIVGEEKQIDLDRDGTADVAIALKEIFTEQNQKKARLALQKPILESTEDITASSSDVELIAQGGAKVIQEKANPDRFTIEITVMRNCYIIYYLDKNDREEKASYKGDTLSLTADRTVDLRFSDGGSVKIKIAGNDLDIGQVDQLYASQIKWVKGENNQYKLVSIPIKY
jgi:cytoskeletal protein RodZ